MLAGPMGIIAPANDFVAKVQIKNQPTKINFKKNITCEILFSGRASDSQ